MCKPDSIKAIREKSVALREAMIDLLKEIERADICPDVEEKMADLLSEPAAEIVKFHLNMELLHSIHEDIQDIQRERGTTIFNRRREA